MRLPEGVEWALHCTWLLTVARDRDALPARRLAEFYDLPEAYLAKLLKTLVRAGLLSATSGPRGGFRLARPPGDITVADVVEAVEGPSPLFHCTEIRQRGPVPLTGEACRQALRHRPGHGPGRAGLARRNWPPPRSPIWLKPRVQVPLRE